VPHIGKIGPHIALRHGLFADLGVGNEPFFGRKIAYNRCFNLTKGKPRLMIFLSNGGRLYTGKTLVSARHYEIGMTSQIDAMVTTLFFGALPGCYFVGFLWANY